MRFVFTSNNEDEQFLIRNRDMIEQMNFAHQTIGLAKTIDQTKTCARDFVSFHLSGTVSFWLD